MGPSENTEIASAAYRAFNLGGVDAILEYLDPEIEWHMWEQFSRGSRVFRGHAGVREVLAAFEDNYDNFRADPGELIESDGRVVAPVRLHGEVKGTGEHHSFELVQVWTARDGKAIRLDVYSTLEDAWRELEGTSDSGGDGPAR